jgi:2-dehydro-3-deoxyphosphogluconate aldolase/(4S)-4-hydroxy-2-oxoglutarate aldolase
LPILVTDDVDQAIHCVNALAANGQRWKSTAYTECADGAERSRESLPASHCRCRHHSDTAQLDGSLTGAAFGISPGITPVLAAAARDSALPYFPGVGGASDLMLAVEHGFKVVKLFPADLVGGVKMAKALGGPFPDVKFCLTGGVTVESTANAAQPNAWCRWFMDVLHR